MGEFFKKLVYFVKSLFPPECYHNCYRERAEAGIVSDGICGGVCGGSRATNYLSEMCIDCPYFNIGVWF